MAISLKDHLQNVINDIFKKVKQEIVIKDIFFYRIAIGESYFDSYEPIDDLNRFNECSPIMMELSFNVGPKWYEYIITYSRNHTGDLKVDSSKLKYYDYSEGEDYKLIETQMETTVDLISKGLIPEILKILQLRV